MRVLRNLLVGAVMVVAASVFLAGCGAALIGVSLFPFALSWIDDIGVDLEDASAAARELSFVEEASYESDWLDGSSLYVDVGDDASSAEARRVWCEALLPHGVDMGIGIVTDGHSRDWPPPGDCADGSDVPAASAW